MQSRRFSDISVISAIVALMLGFTASPVQATSFTCVNNGTVKVCAEWSDPVAPVDGTNFRVTFNGAAGADLELLTGDPEWRLWTTLVSSGAVTDFGAITLNPTVNTDNFTVRIWGNNEAGAANVGSIVLDDAGFTGYSSLAGVTIDGHVTGAITLVEFDDGVNPPVGGEVTGLVLIGYGISPEFGGVVGPITIPKVSANVLIRGNYGDVNASHNIDLGVIVTSSTFKIGGDFLSDSSSTVAVNIDSVGVAPNDVGVFEIGGSFTNSKATVTITDMPKLTSGASLVKFGGDFGGTLDLKQGVPGTAATNVVQIKGTLLAPSGGIGGKIKLNNKNLDGNLLLGAAGLGTEILNGRQVSGVFYPCEFGGEFAGTATFAGVAAGGAIYAFGSIDHHADISGAITIMNDYAGLFEVDGDFTSTASLTIHGDLKTNSGEDGLIEIAEAAAGVVTIKGDLIGHVDYAKTFTGSLTVEGNVTSSGLFKTGAGITGETHSGALTFRGNVLGDILIHGTMSGAIKFDADFSGDLSVDEDLISDLNSGVTVLGALANSGLVGGGRILIAGESSVPIKVGKNTGSLTLIQVAGGLASGSTIEINTSRGVFDAEGDIHIGPAGIPVALPFDGCIRIYGNGAGSGGALDGDIDIVSCHDPSGETLMICIDGAVNGNVNLDQTGCPGTPADWGCPLPGCP